MNSNDNIKTTAQFLRAAVEAMEDGAITPAEGIHLCQAATGILNRLLTLSDKRFVIFGIRAGVSVLSWLEHDLNEHIEDG